jgi:uncharacterized protein (DUF2062 family)/SAM-dependent methyltransferase
LAKFSLFREEVRRVWREMRGDAMSPARGAAAVALGLFIGSQPIFGCHTPLVLGLCLWFRLDAAIAWVASNVSNPFFAPALLTAEVQVGAWLRTGAPIRIDQAITQAGAFSSFAGYMFLGAPVVGLALAAAGAAATYAGVLGKRALVPGDGRRVEPYRLPDDAPPWVRAVERVATRYVPLGFEGSTPAQRTRFHYVRTKLLGDPVARLIADVAGDAEGALGEVLDIGTGAGQLPILLLELGRATRARGVDWDAAKIADGARAAGAHDGIPALDAVFTRGDARTAVEGDADTVLLIDLLHYFTIEEQDAILRRAAGAVRQGGRLVVREADAERGWRTAATLLEERIFTSLRFNRGERVRFRAASELVALLEGLGFSCRLEPAWGKTPFANVLIVAAKRASA